MDNGTRKALIDKGKSVGFTGDYLEVFRAYDQGVDVIGQFVAQQQQASGVSPLVQSLKTPDPSQQMMVPQQKLPQVPTIPSAPPSAPQTRMSIPPQAPSPLVNSAEASGVGLASTAKGPSGGREIMRHGGFKKLHKTGGVKKTGDPKNPKDRAAVRQAIDSSTAAYGGDAQVYIPEKKQWVRIPRNGTGYTTNMTGDQEFKVDEKTGNIMSDKPLPEDGVSFTMKGMSVSSGKYDYFKDLGIDPKNVGIRMVQWPTGHKTMPSGHVGGFMYDKTTGKYLGDMTYKDKDGKDVTYKGYINRNTHGNTYMDPDKELKNSDVRSVDITDLTPAQLDNFLTQAGQFQATGAGEKSDKKKILFGATAMGEHDEKNYDLVTNNCVSGVCKGLGIDDKQFLTYGMPDPMKAMDYFQKGIPGYTVSNPKGNRVGQEQQISNLAQNMAGVYVNPDNAKDFIQHINSVGEGEAKNSIGQIGEAVNAWKDSEVDMEGKLKETSEAYNAIPEGTIPKALGVVGKQALDNSWNYGKEQFNNLYNKAFKKTGGAREKCYTCNRSKLQVLYNKAKYKR